MTCIVGLEHAGVVYIGGDSAGVAGLSISSRADGKVFTNGPMAFGFTTSFRMGQLLRYALKVPFQQPDETDDQYMVTTFVNEVRKCLKDGGYAKKENEAEQGGQFLVGYKGRLYCLDSDYQVGRSRHPYDAVGCGQDIALGAMHALHQKGVANAAEAIRAALLAAEEFSAGVRAPFEIVAK